MATITALVTVYHGTDEHDLVRALDSLAAQTRPADELVIVADGPVASLLGADGAAVRAVDPGALAAALEDVARLTRSLDKVRPFITTLDWTPGGLTDAADLRARVAPVAEPQQLSLF